MDKEYILSLLGFIVLALFPLIDMVASYLELRKLRIYEGRTTGKVVEIREEIHYERIFTRVIMYYLTYEYMVDETIYRLEPGWGTLKILRYPLGTEVEIYYDKKCPQKFTVGGEEEVKHWKHSIYSMIAISAIPWFIIIGGIIYAIKKQI